MALNNNNLVRIGSVLFVLRGILNLIVSIGGIIGFYTIGPAGMFSLSGETLKPSQITPALEAASHIALNYSLILTGYGVLVIWMAIHIWRGIRIALWINIAMLFILDFAFIYSLIIPGYIPAVEGLVGPVLTISAVILTCLGFKRLDEDKAMEKVTSGWVPFDRRTRPRD